uniref:Guanylate cyclase domain-containing protein n=2 Tax=Dunaliella tertiolecta TaxID=3047 RepID=A0A7S3VPL3_DUNTE
MFPRHVLEYMVAKQHSHNSPDLPVRLPSPSQAPNANQLASSHENVTILFTDIVGFTAMSKEVKPDQVMAYLNELFTAFDALVDTYEIYKVETAGDCYIAAGGLTLIDEDGFTCIDPTPDPQEAAQRVLSFAKALLYCAKKVVMPHNGEPTQIRVGIHTGPAVTGLIGTKLPKYSVFGDTMNTASRMESTCPYGCIQISQATHTLLPNHPFTPTGGVEVKGKGRMLTFLWSPEVDHPGEDLAASAQATEETIHAST